MHEPEYRIMQVGRRYVLGEGEDFYGIWDRELPGKPVETFPLTDGGVLEATKRFSQLSRQDFWVRFGPKALRWALFAGLAVWILGSIVLWIRYSLAAPDFAIPPGELVTIYEEPLWARLAQLLQDLGFRVWVGALAVIFALWLLDRGRQQA